jgi:Ubiquitin-2 like Rad60 SUMO-like
MSEGAEIQADSQKVKTEQGNNETINVKVRVTLPCLDLILEWRAEYRVTRRRSQVVSAAGEEVFFKIKRNTKLSKLQGAYANKVGKDVGSIRCVSFPFIFFFFWWCYLYSIFVFNDKNHQSRGYVDTNSEAFGVTVK